MGKGIWNRIAGALMMGALTVLGGAIGTVIASEREPVEALMRLRTLWVLGALFVGGAVFGFFLSGMQAARGGKTGDTPALPGPWQIAFVAAMFNIALVALSWFLLDLWGAELSDILSFNWPDVLWGIAATAPPLAALLILVYVPFGPFRRFMAKQVKHFSESNVVLGPITIVIVSIGAGVGEEMLFRGALQLILTEWAGLIAAIVVTSVLFGLLHAANVGYVLLTTLFGAYFAVVMVVTGNILVPIIAHALYDVVALAMTAQMVRAYRAQQA